MCVQAGACVCVHTHAPSRSASSALLCRLEHAFRHVCGHVCGHVCVHDLLHGKLDGELVTLLLKRAQLKLLLLHLCTDMRGGYACRLVLFLRRATDERGTAAHVRAVLTLLYPVGRGPDLA